MVERGSKVGDRGSEIEVQGSEIEGQESEIGDEALKSLISNLHEAH